MNFLLMFMNIYFYFEPAGIPRLQLDSPKVSWPGLNTFKVNFIKFAEKTVERKLNQTI